MIFTCIMNYTLEVQMIPTVFTLTDFPIERDGKRYVTAETLGEWLGFSNPRKAVMNLLDRHRNLIGPFTGVLKLRTPGGTQDVTVFTPQACLLSAMKAETAEAKLIQIRLAEFVAAFEALRPEIIARFEAIEAEWLKTAQRKAQRRFKSMRKNLGISSRRWKDIWVLFTLGRPMTVSEIAKLLGLTPQQVDTLLRTYRNSQGDFSRRKQPSRKSLAPAPRQIAATSEVAS